jgi:hypothetical protein
MSWSLIGPTPALVLTSVDVWPEASTDAWAKATGVVK